MRKIMGILFLGFFMNVTYAKYNSTDIYKGDILMNKPYLTLHINMAGCGYKVLVNDAPVFSMINGGVITTDVPINEWVKSGKNTFGVELYQVKTAKKVVAAGQACDATVALQVRPSGTQEQPQIIAKIHYTSRADAITVNDLYLKGSSPAGVFNSKDHFAKDKDGDVKVGEIKGEMIKGKYGAGVKLTRTVDMPLPFPKWAWFSGQKIADDVQTKQELTSQYHKIWEALHNKNFQKIAPFFEERTQELSEAYYIKDTANDNTVRALTKAVNNKEMELGGFIPGPKYVELKVFAHGHLAELTSLDDQSVLFFNDKDGVSYTNYSIIYMKKNNKWIIIR